MSRWAWRVGDRLFCWRFNTTYDTYASVPAHPFHVSGVVFMIRRTGFLFPDPRLTAAWHSDGIIRPPSGPLMQRGVFGGVVVSLKLRLGHDWRRVLDKWAKPPFFEERHPPVFCCPDSGGSVLRKGGLPRRIALMALIALGAVMVENGS